SRSRAARKEGRVTTTPQTDTRAIGWARSRALCAALAPLFDYRTASGIGSALARRAARAAARSRAGGPPGEVLREPLNTPIEEAQEDYARTFYVTPSCEPYVSVHLFGSESFDRGALMACLRERFEGAGFSPGTELPDHVAVLLRFAALLDPEEFDDLA